MTICSFVLCSTIRTDSGPAISHAINYSYESWNQHNQRNKTTSDLEPRAHIHIHTHKKTNGINQRPNEKLKKKKLQQNLKKKKLNDPATYSNPRGIEKEARNESCVIHSRLFHTHTHKHRQSRISWFLSVPFSFSLYLSHCFSFFFFYSRWFMPSPKAAATAHKHSDELVHHFFSALSGRSRVFVYRVFRVASFPFLHYTLGYYLFCSFIIFDLFELLKIFIFFFIYFCVYPILIVHYLLTLIMHRFMTMSTDTTMK